VSVVIANIDIAAPIDEVWDKIMDPDCIRQWVTIVDSIDHVDRGPMRPGFRMDQTLQLRGVRFKVRWTLAEIDAPARWRSPRTG
jgi:carbon monoxide dehydrogenase subunit G